MSTGCEEQTARKSTWGCRSITTAYLAQWESSHSGGELGGCWHVPGAFDGVVDPELLLGSDLDGQEP